MNRPVRRRLQRVVQKERDANYRRRATAILMLNKSTSVSETARRVSASRTSIRDWRVRFEEFGEVGLVPERQGRPAETVNETLCGYLLKLIEEQPGSYGYLSSRWSSEMLARQLYETWSVVIHSSTVRRLLPKLGVCWNRARPTLCIKDPTKARKMKAINKALRNNSVHTPVFYIDEADIDFNPRIGSAWMSKGEQTAIPTPGKNQKRYLAGALHAHTGNVVWVEWEKKNSQLFVRLLAALRKRYRQAKQIIVIADNYVIHKSAFTQCFLRHNRKFKILFQPAYHPWVNKIELLWKQLHDTITRNHRHSTMNRLMHAVRTFMELVAPFPGSLPHLVKVQSGQVFGSPI